MNHWDWLTEGWSRERQRSAAYTRQRRRDEAEKAARATGHPRVARPDSGVPRHIPAQRVA